MRRDFIKMRDMMKSLFTGLPADLTFITYSESRKTGGKVKKLKNARLLWVENEEGNEVEPNHVPEVLSTKQPNHHLHGSINIKTINGDIIKLRKIFITTFNKMEVVL